jgi:hypothetical protein
MSQSLFSEVRGRAFPLDSHLERNFLMSLSLQRKFLVFGAVPVAVLCVAGASAFTFGQDI